MRDNVKGGALTEVTFFILLSLYTPRHGYAIMQFVEEQLREAGAISHYKMMGDYVVYCDLKVVGVVCGNQFYIKRLPVSEPFFPNATPVAPTGGKDTHFLVENLEDTAFLAQLVRAVCDALPPPKPKKRKEKAT